MPPDDPCEVVMVVVQGGTRSVFSLEHTFGVSSRTMTVTSNTLDFRGAAPWLASRCAIDPFTGARLHGAHNPDDAPVVPCTMCSALCERCWL